MGPRGGRATFPQLEQTPANTTIELVVVRDSLQLAVHKALVSGAARDGAGYIEDGGQCATAQPFPAARSSCSSR